MVGGFRIIFVLTEGASVVHGGFFHATLLRFMSSCPSLTFSASSHLHTKLTHHPGSVWHGRSRASRAHSATSCARSRPGRRRG
ncbi:hypothetical protein B0H16DRAFT_1500913 [Mycena metata]|uniref:Uncharacterized protein n=1 Tax=Mycena metata TaxID=1033252 RepID=A0AAD7K7Z3_9AGAR|nr:hypothetical protein B0H16DRAFT_1500913 [Mycena metata]